MKLDGRRESSNVEDRRGMSGGAKAGLGIGGIIVVALMAWMTGGNPLEAVMQQVQENGGLGSLAGTNTEVSEGQREFTEEEQALAKFSTQILAGTEDVWSEIFKQNGAQYKIFLNSFHEKTAGFFSVCMLLRRLNTTVRAKTQLTPWHIKVA